MGEAAAWTIWLLLTLGTGIGGGIIIRRPHFAWPDRMAGELGHITISPNGNPCGCGNRGCLEKHASATAVSAMARLLGLGPALTAQQVHDLAAAGNDRARKSSCDGRGPGNSPCQPDQYFQFPPVPAGRRRSGAWEFFSPAMLAEVERRCFTYRSTLKIAPTRIEPAQLGSDAGLYGAACLPPPGQWN